MSSLFRPTPALLLLFGSLATGAGAGAERRARRAAGKRRRRTLPPVNVTAERRVENIKDVPSSVSTIAARSSTC
jgi:outer membrane receptor protein involved in Fe transport